MTLTRGCWRSALGLLLLVGCSQSEPFSNPEVGSDGPASPAVPVRLTYNSGRDLTPAIDPQGTTLLYAFTAAGLNGDQCLASMRVSGGTRMEYCPTSAASRDSIERAEEPAWLDDAMLAYVRGVKLVGADRDHDLQLGTAPLADPTGFTPRLAFPMTVPGGAMEELPTHLVPVGDGRVAYMGEVTLSFSCGKDCVIRDSVGREVAIVELAGSGPPTIVPGTDYVTGLSTGPAVGDLVYTLVADSAVYLRTSSGTVSVLHRFSEIAREVQYRSGRLAAVVGGDVTNLTSDTGEPLQIDKGGRLEVVDLASGTTQRPAPDGFLVRRLTLAPDARSVVVQVGLESADLYRVDVP